jgi:hypothetical protein
MRTRNAQLTKIGKVEASAFIGVLTESRFFDTVSTNNYRAISGIRATLRPAFDSTMTLGIARLSMTPVARPAEAGRHALDALTIWEPLASPGDTLDDGSTRQRNDQLFEVFVRFHFPESGFQAYAELARMENPRSLGEWLVAPHSTQGWLMGLEWLGDPLWRDGRLRLHSEFSYVEQTSAFPDRPPPDFYTGRATVHGWTQRGQILGLSTGPGSSEQYIGLDAIFPRRSAGWFAGRIRWENDALYRQPEARLTQHDVTIYTGARAGSDLPWYRVDGELTISRRLNYLFQNEAFTPSQRDAVDLNNYTLTLKFTPR